MAPTTSENSQQLTNDTALEKYTVPANLYKHRSLTHKTQASVLRRHDLQEHQLLSWDPSKINCPETFLIYYNVLMNITYIPEMNFLLHIAVTPDTNRFMH